MRWTTEKTESVNVSVLVCENVRGFCRATLFQDTTTLSFVTSVFLRFKTFNTVFWLFERPLFGLLNKLNKRPEQMTYSVPYSVSQVWFWIQSFIFRSFEKNKCGDKNAHNIEKHYCCLFQAGWGVKIKL